MLETTRRRMLHFMALLGLGGTGLTRAANAAIDGSTEPDAWPTMAKRTLGKTGFEGSRLVFGCGAALMFWRRDELLESALEHGVNVFDVGTSDYYRYAEENLSAFAKKNRDQIFLISKGLVGLEIEPGQELTAEQQRAAAQNWSNSLDQSLTDLAADHVDAYYVMAANNVSLIKSEEMHAAFQKAKQAGKVDHWGVSTHQNAQAVLEAMAETGWYSLVQIAVTPAGWYDWNSKDVDKASQPMKALRPTFDKARAAGIGLIGMKAARHLAGSFFGLGPDKLGAFDAHYDDAYLRTKLSAFQRSYAYVLAHGLDAVNADSQSIEHLQENHVAAATAEQYFA